MFGLVVWLLYAIHARARGLFSGRARPHGSDGSRHGRLLRTMPPGDVAHCPVIRGCPPRDSGLCGGRAAADVVINSSIASDENMTLVVKHTTVTTV